MRSTTNGVRGFLQDKETRLSRENRRLGDRLVKTKAQRVEFTSTQDYYQRLSDKKNETEGAGVECFLRIRWRKMDRGTRAAGRRGVKYVLYKDTEVRVARQPSGEF